MEQVRHESRRRLDLLGHLAPWLTILGTIIFFYVRNPHTFGTTRLLLAVLAVDAFRNILENIYFGLYFGSVYEVLPSQLAAVMGHPVLLILPKFLNVAAGSVVLCLLLWRWLPLAVTERSQAAQRASDLETLASSAASAARNLPSCCRRRPRPQRCNLPSGCAGWPAIAHSQQRGGNPGHDQRRDCRHRGADARRRPRAVSSETLRPRSDRGGAPR
jgi:hypothetical protein